MKNILWNKQRNTDKIFKLKENLLNSENPLDKNLLMSVILRH